MICRINSLNEIESRIILHKDDIGLTTFRRYPNRLARESEVPCLFMFEGPDKVIKKSTKSNLGYPKRRNLESILELIDYTNVIFPKIISLRDYILGEDSRLTDDSFIDESYIEGPIGYGIDNIVVCRIIFTITYKDDNSI